MSPVEDCESGLGDKTCNLLNNTLNFDTDSNDEFDFPIKSAIEMTADSDDDESLSDNDEEEKMLIKFKSPKKSHSREGG